MQHFVGLVTMADPQLVLRFLPPDERRVRSAHLEHEIVLVPAAHLANGEAPAGAVVESKEH